MIVNPIVKKLEKMKLSSLSNHLVMSHPEKILYPEDNITKQDLFDYYDIVSDYMIPYLSLRPLTIVRCLSDYKECFYQRHLHKISSTTLHTIKTTNGEGQERSYIYLNDKPGLMSLVQMDVLEIHPWGCTINQLDKPDQIIFDLDPDSDIPWYKVAQAARNIRDRLTQYKLTSFVKSTGGKGLHVIAPIVPQLEWRIVKSFTHKFVQELERLEPEIYVSSMSKTKRRGKIFIDYLRNQLTSTTIAPYSTRARLHATIATPLSWDELSNQREDNIYTIKTLPKRLAQLKNDPWKDFLTTQQFLNIEVLN